MKRTIVIFIFMMTLVLALSACSKKNELIKKENLESVTLNVQIKKGDDNPTEYTIKRNGDAYSYTKGNTTEYYYDFGDKTYQIESLNDVVTSTVSTREFSSMFNAFEDITKDDLNENNDGSYSFKEGSEPKVYSLFMESFALDGRTMLKEGYDAGLIDVNSTKIFISNGKLTLMNIFVQYNGENVGLTVNAKDHKVTKVTMPTETEAGKEYASNIDKNNAVVTLKFDNIGTIKFQLFSYEDEEMLNIVNYFIYLFKKGKFNKLGLTTVETNDVLLDSSKKMESTVKAPSKSTISNKRGTVAMTLLDSDDNSTQAFVINTGDNSSKDSSFIVVGGVIEGFDVLDKLAQLSLGENETIEVKVSIKYNKFKYNKPTLQ